ncbi:MAG TPA: rhodanese-like domain-containing protein [Candidatus Methanoperedens sp.]|nr:rhodanese-like domain-containing protein [Candidatus Methanoperedens sp.]
MKRKALVIASVVVGLSLAGGAAGYVFFGPASSAAGPASTFRSITPLQAKTLIETRPDLQLIDCRSPGEFRQGALPGSTLIPFWDFTKGNYHLPQDKPILLVCAVGGRSLAVGQLLSARGYGEVYNLRGGLDAWIEQKVPLPFRR